MYGPQKLLENVIILVYIFNTEIMIKQ